MVPCGIRFDRFYCRRFEGHPTYAHVDMFYKSSHDQKHVLTQSFKRDFHQVPKNVVLISNNPTISAAIAHHYGCTTEVQWLTVPKHVAEVLRMDMAILMNTYCDLKSREQCWDIHYHTPVGLPTSFFAMDLRLATEGADETQA